MGSQACLWYLGQISSRRYRVAGLAVNRYENKYLVSRQDHQMMGRLFSAVLARDPHAGTDGTYAVRSLYFDTPANAGFHAKIDGLAERRKIRLRVYDVSQNQVKLEHKAKSGNAQRKESLWVSRGEADLLCGGSSEFLRQYQGDPSATSLLHAFLGEPLRPVVLVEYDREAYVCLSHNVRINFDLRMRATASSLALFNPTPLFTPLSDQGDIVLEVKHGGHLPDFLRDILSAFHPVRTSYSKYCAAREQLF
jgi:hypothetical protein